MQSLARTFVRERVVGPGVVAVPGRTSSGALVTAERIAIAGWDQAVGEVGRAANKLLCCWERMASIRLDSGFVGSASSGYSPPREQVPGQIGETPMTAEPWVSVRGVATQLGIGKDSVYRWIETRSLSAHKIDRLWKFKLPEVDRWVRAGGGDAHDDDASKGVAG